MRKIIISALIIGLWSCTKKVTCDGVVYSRNGVVMPNTEVHFQVYGSASSYPSWSRTSITDANGRFYFNENVNKKHPMDLQISCDSGYVSKRLGKPRDQTDFHVILELH